MGSGGGSGSGTTTQEASIAPELRPLFSQTGEISQNLQSAITPYFGEFFAPQVQQIPGMTPGQYDLNAAYRNLAFAPGLTPPQMDSYASLMDLTSSPVGSSPATQAAMAAAREPVVNELANAGLGNSSYVGYNLGAAYAPILAEEMQQRFQAIPALQNLGTQEYQQRQGNLTNYANSEEQRRGILETQEQAVTQDLLRRQGLGTQFTTGILGGFPAVTGSTSSTKNKSSGGGMSVICTELHRQGLMDDETYRCDEVFGRRQDLDVIRGYHRLACPVVEAMRRSVRLTKIVACLTAPWVRQMRHEVAGDVAPSWIGKAIMAVGVPICRFVGRLNSEVAHG